MPFDVTQLMVVLTNLSHQKTLESGPVQGLLGTTVPLTGSWGSFFCPLKSGLIQNDQNKISEPSVYNPPTFHPYAMGKSPPLGSMKLQ